MYGKGKGLMVVYFFKLVKVVFDVMSEVKLELVVKVVVVSGEKKLVVCLFVGKEFVLAVENIVRVDIKCLDEIMNMVGELVLVCN